MTAPMAPPTTAPTGPPTTAPAAAPPTAPAPAPLWASAIVGSNAIANAAGTSRRANLTIVLLLSGDFAEGIRKPEATISQPIQFLPAALFHVCSTGSMEQRGFCDFASG